MTRTLFDVDATRTVMTYNLKNGGNIFHWMQRGEAVVDVIRAANPTLLGTQEGFDFQLEFIAEQLPHLAYVGVGRGDDGSDEYSAIFYDTRVVTPQGSGSWWLSPTPQVAGSMMDGEDLPRMATWLRCTMAGWDRSTVHINTHLTHTGISTDAQMAALIAGIDDVTSSEDDVIVTGDFNQHRESAAWHALIDAGFTDALSFASHHGPQFTFPDWDPVIGDVETSRPMTDRIDWIFYRAGAGNALPSNVEMRTINTHTGEIIPSDHFPVLLTNGR